jgi:translation initiation factor IF-2
VTNGLVEKLKVARVVRNGGVLYEGESILLSEVPQILTVFRIAGNLDTLRHLKKDITEARKGLESGMSFENWEDLREGDLIQFPEIIEKPGTL